MQGGRCEERASPRSRTGDTGRSIVRRLLWTGVSPVALSRAESGHSPSLSFRFHVALRRRSTGRQGSLRMLAAQRRIGSLPIGAECRGGKTGYRGRCCANSRNQPGPPPEHAVTPPPPAPTPAPVQESATPPAPPAPLPAASGRPGPQQLGAVRAACSSDFGVHCPSAKPGGSAALRCLQVNAPALSPECKNAVMTMGEDGAPPPAAAAPPIAPEAAPVRRPLGPIPLMRPRQALAILQICRVEQETLCGDVPAGGGRIIACLAANAPRLSPACYNALASVSR